MSAGLHLSSPPTVPRAVHDSAVADLLAQYRAFPPGERVRLGKKTSNLFRFGAGAGDHRRLDTSAFTGVIEVDPVARTAQVQGMTTYEHLVDVTLAHGLMPLVVPQLKTITLGGAVTGLGIESTSFRHGLPHESVLEMDVLLPSGELITVRPEGEHADLFAGFANSYATLGYALRLEIELQPVSPYVRLEHHRVPTGKLVDAIQEACAGPADFVDGVVFTRDEQYLTLAYLTDDPGRGVSDYTGQQVFYRSVRERTVDHLTIHDYLWRWDTDWFWCSAALGAQHPLVRRVWPGRYRRSDVYRRIVALDRRTRFSSRVRGLLRQPQEEPVIQDVEIPVERLPEFLDAFQRDVGIEPVWLCPLQLRGERTWPLYPMAPHELYVNVGFWSTVPEVPGDPEGHNRRVEELVAGLGGHKSLYSTVHYDEPEFWEHYNGPAYRSLKDRYDPDGRLPDLYSKVTGEGMMQVAEIIAGVIGPDVPVRIIGYDGSKAGPDSAEGALRITSPRALARLVTAPGTLGLARAYVTGEIEVEGELYGVLAAMPDVILHDIPRAQRLRLARQLVPVWMRHRMPPPEFEFRPPGRLHSKARDRKAISHHYDVSNAFYSWVLGPSMAYTCAVYPSDTATLEEAQAEKHELVSRKLALEPGMRLLDVGCGWGGMVMHAAAEHGVQALGVTLSANQAAWAQAEITRRGLDGLAEVRHVDYRDAPENEFDAISSIGLTEHIGRAQLPSYFASLHARLRPGGRLLNHCITESRTPARRLDPFIGRYIFPDGELHTVGHVIGTMNDAGFEIRHEENFREHYARTLAGWGANLEANWDSAVAEVGLGRAKVWRLYMAACRLGFERDNIQLHQVLGERGHGDGRSGFPLRGW